MSINTSLRFLAIAGVLFSAKATFAKDSMTMQSLADDTLKSQSSGVYKNSANPEFANALATQNDRENLPNFGNISHDSKLEIAAKIGDNRFGTDEDNGTAATTNFPSPSRIQLNTPARDRIGSLPAEPIGEASIVIPVPPPLTSVIKGNPFAPSGTAPSSTATPSAPGAATFNNRGTVSTTFDSIYPLASIAPTTSGYGWRTHPLTGTRRFHSGIDIAAPTGTPVLATGSGTVVTAGWLNGYGKAVVIQHSPSKQTVYGHLSQISVQQGQTIAQGTIVGKVGSTGNSTGPHLHYEVRMPNGNSWTAVNPTEEFKYAAENLRRSQPFAQKDIPSGF